jgi:hypothetical protein
LKFGQALSVTIQQRRLRCAFPNQSVRISATMTEFSFSNVTVASSGGEYFQVSFADKEDSDDAYFLIQRQFESPDRGHVYIESHQRILCGHFKIRKAELRRDHASTPVKRNRPISRNRRSVWRGVEIILCTVWFSLRVSERFSTLLYAPRPPK